MDVVDKASNGRKLAAYIVPFGVFLGALAAVSGLKAIGGPFWLASPEYWVYPLQTLLCAALLFWYRREYEFNGLRQPLVAVGIGLVVLVMWISPQAFFGAAARTEGFNPTIFADQPAAYWATVMLRFLRLVVIVPLVEEIFWRGFLLRYFVDEKFDRVPFGTFSWLSFGAVSVGFMFVHSMADWPAALLTGALYNFVAYRTKSLGACVLAHAVTNLLLGLWIMSTRQWGFW
jgi:CAAX prenyl protease-like protein